MKSVPFFWQGTLIVLPAMVLSGFGLYSLRQDRALAEHEARSQAKKIAAELVQDLADAFRISAPGGHIFSNGNFPPPQEEFIFQTWRRTGGAISARFDESGKMIYPPPLQNLPLPAPLEPEILSAEQWGLWVEFTNLLYLERDLFSAQKVWEDLEPLPERFRAVGAHDLAQSLFREGELERARWYWYKIVNGPWLPGETGFPLKISAALRLIPMMGEDPAIRIQLVQMVAAYAVLHPSPISVNILDWLQKTVSTHPDHALILAQWNQIAQLHATARALAKDIEIKSMGEVDAGWTHQNEEVYWLAFNPAQDGLNVFAWPKSLISKMAQEKIRSRSPPEYFGFNLSISGRPILQSSPKSEILAAASGGFPEGTQPELLNWEIFLSNPQQLYARQKIRSFWFGALVLVSSGAVLAGFISARKAFHRQRELSEMRSNFVSSVSHEMRAPLASVRLMADELQEIGWTDKQKTKEYHRFIGQECRRLSSLIENVLDFSRHEQGRAQIRFDRVNLPALLEETMALMQVCASEKNVFIQSNWGKQQIKLDADAPALQRVFINLLDNAIKHSPPGGRVELGCAVLNEGITVWVQDDGPGIPPQEQIRIFDRFYRCGSELRRETPGIGLGLAIVKMIVEAHRGTVWVESEPGHGAKFICQFLK